MILIKENVIGDLGAVDPRSIPQRFGQDIFEDGEDWHDVESLFISEVINDFGRRFRRAMPETILDSRVHMLKPGWFPCIPGWHYDEVERFEGGDLVKEDGAVLDWDRTYEGKEHYMMILDFGSGSLTEFARARVADPRVKNYTELNRLFQAHSPLIEQVKSNAIYRFDILDAHRGVPAKRDGWRYFIRATVGTQRILANELRTQTQVYIPAFDVGW